MKPQSFKAAE